MKKLIVLLAAVALIFCAVPAMADNNQDQNQNPEGDGTQSQAQAGAYVDNSDHSTYKGAPEKRALPAGVMGGYNIVPPNVLNGMITGNVQLVGDILTVRDTYTLRMLLALDHKSDAYEIFVSAYQSNRVRLNNPVKGVKGMDLDTKITIEKILRVKDGDNKGRLILPDGVDVAFLRGQCDDTDSATMSLMAGMAIEAMRHGADTLAITGEGARKVLEASGWGFQIGTTGATISDKDTSAMGAVVGGGFGYGEAKGHYGYEPWLQSWAFRTE